jgi:hypothetical protein
VPVLPTNQAGSPHGISQGCGRLGDCNSGGRLTPRAARTPSRGTLADEGGKFGRWPDEALTHTPLATDCRPCNVSGWQTLAPWRALSAPALPASQAGQVCDVYLRSTAVNGTPASARLVGQKGPKLGKRPTVVRSALRPLNRCPLADVRQVFDGNPAPGACALPNDSLADPVVQVRRKARFLSAPGVQPIACGFGPISSEDCAVAERAACEGWR